MPTFSSRLRTAGLGFMLLAGAAGCSHTCTNDVALARRQGPGVGGNIGVAELAVFPLAFVGLALDATAPSFGVCDGRCCAGQHRLGKSTDCSCSKECRRPSVLCLRLLQHGLILGELFLESFVLSQRSLPSRANELQ